MKKQSALVKRHVLLAVFAVNFFLSVNSFGQSAGLRWSVDGNSYFKAESGEIIKYTLPQNIKKVVLSKDKLTPVGQNKSLSIVSFIFSDDEQKILIYTNTKKVWRYDTRGDYWLYNFVDESLTQLGKTLPASSLMFAKFSPDGDKVAYVSDYNIYVEWPEKAFVKKVTTDGSRKLINGTFDWAYEEEFFLPGWFSLESR